MDGKLKIGNLKTECEQRMMPLVNRLPRRLNKITEDLEHGRFAMRVRALDHPSDRRFFSGLSQKLVVAVLAGSAVLGAILLITSNEGTLLTRDIHVYGFFGFVPGPEGAWIKACPS